MNKQKNIEIEKLRPFEGHPYKVLDNEEMQSLTESIQEQDVLSPLIVRPIENTDQYEIISGHRRFHAAQKAGLKAVPAFVFEIDRDAAAVMLVDSNLHREHILPSEKAFAYKLKYDALKHQGTSSQVGTRLRTDELMTHNADDSRNQIQRYIRLTHLIPEILQYVDDGKIAFTPAVELSFLNEQEQYDLLEQMEINDCTPSYSQACRLKKASQETGLTPDSISQIMSEEKANQKEMFKMPMERIKKYVPSGSEKSVSDFVEKACEYYRKYLNRQRDAR